MNSAITTINEKFVKFEKKNKKITNRWKAWEKKIAI